MSNLKNDNSKWPIMIEMANWDDYALLDMGSGEKLEKFGPIIVRRPEQQALGEKKLSDLEWQSADATFSGNIEEIGSGRWQFKKSISDQWQMKYGPVKFICRFTSFRHVGVFPEQGAHWSWVINKIEGANRPFNILNLFGYTGIISLLAANLGAKVTHIDASRKAIGWARENQELSTLSEKPIRWICEDATKFVEREIKRNRQYDAIILDPPKFGRGPNGETWNLFDDLPNLIKLIPKILSKQPVFVILTTYSINASFIAFHELMNETFSDIGGTLESGELLIREQAAQRKLSTSMFSRWTA